MGKKKGSQRGLRRIVREMKRTEGVAVPVNNLVAKHMHKANRNKVIQNKVEKELEKLATQELKEARDGLLPVESDKSLHELGDEGESPE